MTEKSNAIHCVPAELGTMSLEYKNAKKCT